MVPALTAKDGTVVSAFAEDEAANINDLQLIKARTMFNMVEEVGETRCKLLFLTNPQADLISKSPTNVQKMLDALEVGKPSLVIDLLKSCGGTSHTKILPISTAKLLEQGFLGVVPNRGPYLDSAASLDSKAQLDLFMSDVLIPLAAQTNAIVLCSASDGECSLSNAFMRMFKMVRSKWAGKPPFTVICTTSSIEDLYRNPDEGAYWREVRRASRSWRNRDQQMREAFQSKSGDPARFPRGTDLDRNATCM